MGKEQSNLLTAIDVGSAKVCAIVAEIMETGVRYRGHGVAESRGTRKGVIVDLDKTVASIQRAVEQAESVAGAAVESAVIGVAGPHVRGVNSRGGIAIGSRPRGITREDVRAPAEGARAPSLPPERGGVAPFPPGVIPPRPN